MPVSEPWLVAGINDRAQLSETAARLNALIVRGWQLNGVTIEDPATTWIDLAVRIEPDVTIRPGTQLKGATAIATGAVVGPDTTLVDCEIGANAEVKRTDATLAVIGEGASVGPFSYLRPGTCSAPTARSAPSSRRRTPGSATGCKVPHLSYVGDADDRRGLEHRRRLDLRQLRRREEAPPGDRLAGAHRVARRVRRAD